MLTWPGRAGATLLSPSGRRARLTIFIFHRVLDRADPLQLDEPDVERFRWQMRLIASIFHVLPLPEAVRRLDEGHLPARSACITFDDGYADNFTLAAPVLQELNLTATFFIASGYIDGGVMFNDVVIEAVRNSPLDEVELALPEPVSLDLRGDTARREAIKSVLRALKYVNVKERDDMADSVRERLGAPPAPADLMMTTTQVRTLSDMGMTLGGHTVSHPILARLKATAARREIADNRDWLAGTTGSAPKVFAYPNGVPGDDFLPEHARMVRQADYTAAVSTRPGVAGSGTDRYSLPRFTPWDQSAWRYQARLMRNYLRVRS